MTETTPYPIDFDALERGSIVSKEEIKRAYMIYPEKETDVAKGVEAFEQLQLKKLRLADQIETHFRDERGDTVTVSQKGADGGLRVLTAVEQDEDCVRRYGAAGRKLRDALVRDRGNDPSGLIDDDQKKARDQRHLIWGWRLLQLRKKPPPQLTDGGNEG